MASFVFSESVESLTTRCDYDWCSQRSDSLNAQINHELYASHAYLALSAFFGRDYIGLPGFAKFFRDASEEEREHAEKLIEYQNKRGGQVELKPIGVQSFPLSANADGVSDVVTALDIAIQLEKFVYARLKEVSAVADEKDDGALGDLIDDFLAEQVDGIDKLSQLLSRVKRAGAVGVHLIDQELKS